MEPDDFKQTALPAEHRLAGSGPNHVPRQIGGLVIKPLSSQMGGLGFNSQSGYKVGCHGHSK